MPFSDYKDFKDCVEKNKDKDNPEAFCAYLHHQITGTWPGEHEMSEAEKVVTTKTLYDVEVFATGTWTDSGGNTQKFTTDDLDTMVRNFQEGAPLKAGHSPDEFNAKLAQALDVPVDVVIGSNEGQGAVGLGRMVHLKRAGNRLLAAFRGVPIKVVQLIKDKLYNSVSAELTAADGGYSIRGVALLGCQKPAVDVLEGRLGAAKVYSFTMAEPTISDVTPVPGGKKKTQEDKNNMAQETPVKPEEAPAPPVVPAQASSGAEALKAIAQALNLDPAVATVEQIVEAIKTLTANSPQTTAAQAATGPLMAKVEEAKAMFAAADTKAKTLEAEVAILKRDKKVLTFTERAKSWTSVVTDPAAEVQALVDMPEAQAATIAAGYDRLYEAMKKSTFFERVGSAAGSGAKLPVHEFHAKVLKYAADNKITEGEAMLKYLAEDPKGYQSFMEAARKDGFQSYEAVHKVETK